MEIHDERHQNVVDWCAAVQHGTTARLLKVVVVVDDEEAKDEKAGGVGRPDHEELKAQAAKSAAERLLPKNSVEAKNLEWFTEEFNVPLEL